MHRSQGGDHLSQLEEFIDRGLVDEVIGLIKTGKEATVYCCTGGPSAGAELVAAKVYRGQQYRFQNDAVYQEARARELGLRGSALRAFNKRRKSSIGREVQSGTWRHREFETLELLHGFGGDVPRPIASAGDAILMEYLGDEDEAAQPLNRVRLGPQEAPDLFRRIMANVELMLACDRVHGDLSPHNILYYGGDVWLIDFPQAVDPRFNRHAFELLQRDVDNVCRYFAGFGVPADATRLAGDLWHRFTYAEL